MGYENGKETAREGEDKPAADAGETDSSPTPLTVGGLGPERAALIGDPSMDRLERIAIHGWAEETLGTIPDSELMS